jgi:hypothetical protein
MKLPVLLVAVLAAFTVTDAHTAANGVGPTRAGSGAGAISGYAVSEISYELAGALVTSIAFSLDPPDPRTVRIRVTAAGAWHECAVSGSRAACAVPGIDVAALSRLDVVAAS